MKLHFHLLTVILLHLVRGIEILELNHACGACIQKSPRFYYSCYKCFDNPDTIEFCGYTVNNLLQCPRANEKSSYCLNAYINDALIGTFGSNHYQMERGDTCMIIIKNGVEKEDNQVGFWKIWKDQADLHFFLAESMDSTDDNTLTKITHPGDVVKIPKGDTHYLFVVNESLKKRSFNLNFAGADTLSLQLKLLFISLSLIYFQSSI